MTSSPANSDNAPALRILALDVLMSLRDSLPPGHITAARYEQLDAALLARIMPEQVLLPLFSPPHDATLVIERLQALGYSGRITVVSHPLPDARMVERELRTLGPGSRLNVLTSKDCPS